MITFNPYKVSSIWNTLLPEGHPLWVPKVVRIIADYAYPLAYTTSSKRSATEKLESQTVDASESSKQKKGILKSNGKEYLVKPDCRFRLFPIKDHEIPKYTEKYSVFRGRNYGAATYIGKKEVMEDNNYVEHFWINKEKVDLFCVMDGHGDKGEAGKLIYTDLATLLIDRLEGHQLNDTNITNALTFALVDISDRYYIKFRAGGTTIVACLRVGKRCYFPNVGDSRAIFLKMDIKRACQLTEDADPQSPHFKKYHERMGHVVDEVGVAMPGTNKSSTMASDIGLPFLRSKPKITFWDDPKGYIVLATDGLWDIANNDEVAAHIYKMHLEKKSVEQMAMLLVHAARHNSQSHLDKRNYADNICVMIIDFNEVQTNPALQT